MPAKAWISNILLNSEAHAKQTVNLNLWYVDWGSKVKPGSHPATLPSGGDADAEFRGLVATMGARTKSALDHIFWQPVEYFFARKFDLGNNASRVLHRRIVRELLFDLEDLPAPTRKAICPALVGG